MNYWLIKSEPDVYSFQNLIEEGVGTWDGVRNYQARNNLRAMKLGDVALYYHSNIGLEIVGIASVVKEHFPDTTAEKGDWSAVQFKAVKPFTQPVKLSQIKADEKVNHILLVKNGRLSVMPLEKEDFFHLLSLGKTTL